MIFIRKSINSLILLSKSLILKLKPLISLRKTKKITKKTGFCLENEITPDSLGCASFVEDALVVSGQQIVSVPQDY